MTIGIATTTTAYKCNGREELAWLMNAEEMQDEVVENLRWFVALEQDARGDEPFLALLEEMDEQLPNYTVWRYRYDDGSDEYTTQNRLARICAGRNMAQEWAVRDLNMDHLLFLDSDITPEGDCLPKLRELRQPVVGGHVPVYGMHGVAIKPYTRPADNGVQPPYDEHPEQHVLARIIEDPKVFPSYEWETHKAQEDFVFAHPFIEKPEGWPDDADVQEHWNTAGFLLLGRKVFSRIAWNYDPDAGNSDDPAFQRNCAEMFGHQTWVRHDVTGHHVPGAAGCESHPNREYVR